MVAPRLDKLPALASFNSRGRIRSRKGFALKSPSTLELALWGDDRNRLV